ncbi:MAG: S26 family signal peptidase, partial [Pirellulales bacterium]
IGIPWGIGPRAPPLHVLPSMIMPGHPTNRWSLRRAVETVVSSLIALLLLVNWHVEWFLVNSGSMAQSLLGPHQAVTCSDCRYDFVCGSDPQAMAAKRVICPNCGQTGEALDAAAPTSGDRLLVHKAAYALRGPRRWEVAAFRCPHDPKTVCVKRVVGLPGELIEIKGGDIYADGVIQRKTLAQQRTLAVGVHNDNFRPRQSTLPARWQGENAGTAWRLSARGYVLDPPEHGLPAGGNHIDWLTYRHLQRVPGRSAAVREAPITDAYGYNQTRPVTQSFQVRDLLLAARLQSAGEGSLALAANDGRQRFLVLVQPALRRGTILHNGAVLAELNDLDWPQGQPAHVELSLVDQQFMLALDGACLFSHPYQTTGPANTRAASTAGSSWGDDEPRRPLGIGARGLALEAWDIRVLRDVYYTPIRQAGGADPPVQYRLGPDEYLVLGDNSPQSDDSRTWPSVPGVRAELLLGKPFFVHFPSRLVCGRGVCFQVPDPARIRYIH